MVSILDHRYVVTALKIIIYDNIVCCCLQTLKMYAKTKHNLILYKNISKNSFRK